MAIMRAYEVASMHVSKTCYINMYQNIDEPFQFNASLRHTLVTLVLIANTFSTFISLSFLSHFFFFIVNLSLATALTHAGKLSTKLTTLAHAAGSMVSWRWMS